MLVLPAELLLDQLLDVRAVVQSIIVARAPFDANCVPGNFEPPTDPLRAVAFSSRSVLSLRARELHALDGHDWDCDHSDIPSPHPAVCVVCGAIDW